MTKFLLAASAALLAAPAMAENRIDRIRPDAPELAAHGAHVVGLSHVLSMVRLARRESVEPLRSLTIDQRSPRARTRRKL